ncbi:MAG: hypothetical protein CML39_08070, partial [Rhodobacteraceae bacterium]
GCNLAANENGEKLINGIAEYTLADVAASTDLTGSNAMGGDSDLEFRTGEVLTSVISMSGLTENLVWSDSDIDSQLQWPDLKTLMKSYNNDNVYTYEEMRTVLETAAAGGIHSLEFADLKKIYNTISGASEFATDPGSSDSYVQYITYGTIFPHVANAKWWGGATKLAQVETLGNMQANMSEAKATKLIKKWFYGEDLPMPVAGGDTANPDAAATVGVYKKSTGPMFKKDIDLASNTSSTTAGILVTADDMAQGSAGTCWILACLGAVAHAGTGDAAKAGKAIENLVIDPITDDQIWGMKFYDNNKEAVYVTVNSDIAIKNTTSWSQADKPLYALNAEPVYIDINGDEDGIANGDNLSGAGNLTLDGALVSSGVASMDGGYGKVSIKSSGNDSGITFTIKGEHSQGTSPEVLTGANGVTSTVTQGTKWWKTITEISVSGATDGTVIAGEKGNSWVTRDKDLHGELWAGLFEKGYAQANSYIANRGNSGENSYKVMEGGSAIGLKHLTGNDFQWYGGAASQYQYSNVKQATVQEFADLLAAGAVGYVGGSKSSVDPVTGAKQMVAGHAHMILDYNSTTNEFLIRNPWGGQNSSSRDMEWWASLTELTSESNKNWVAFSQPISIKAAKTYTYTISSDAASGGAAVFEGKPITFTVNRSDVGDETTVYLSTVAGTANGSDYKEYTKTQLKFGKQETQKTFVVETFNDSLNEDSDGIDNFSLGLFTKSTQTSATVSSTAYIKDKVPTNYNYTITSDAGTANKSLTEGGEITFTINRSKVNNSDNHSDSTVYLNTANNTAGSSDYRTMSKFKLDFKTFQESKTITVKTFKDTEDEGKESFNLNLYKDLTAAEAAGTPVATAAGYMEDEWSPSYNYSITSDAGTVAQAKNEGQAITFTVARSGSGTTSKVFVSTLDKSAINGDDFEGISDQELTFKANQKELTVEIKTKLDTWLETTEFFELGLYTDANTKTIEGSSAAFIKNADYKADYYYITNDSVAGGDADGISTAQNLNDPDAISNGDNLSSSGNLTIDGALNSGGTATLNDKVVTITSAGNDSTAKFTVTGTKSAIDLNGDGDTTDAGEGAGAQTEIIWGVNNGTAIGKKLFKTVTQVSVDKATDGNVTTGVSGGGLAINGALNSGGTATLGGKFVSLTSAGNDSSVKFKVTGTDMSDGALTETIFGSSAQTVTGTKLFKTVTKVEADAATAGNVSAGVIGDGTDEGKDITFTITRSNVNNASDKIYLSTSAGSAKETDYEGFQGKEIKFSSFETTKTVTVKAKSDSANDDNEYFWLNMYLNKTALQNDESMVNSKAYIDHVPVPTQHSYVISSNSAADNSNAVTEGNPITFTITRTKDSGSDAPSSLWVSTFAGSANEDDYKPIDKMIVDFGKKELVKTVTVQTKSDTLNSENTEDFYFAAFKTADDAENKNVEATWQYNKAYIKNVAAASYTYTVKADADYDNPVEEGNDILFTITRSATGSASTVYVSTTQGTADADDYTALSAVPVVFAAQQKTKTVKVTSVTDNLTEDKEFVNLNVYKTVDDAESGDYAAWASGYIKDKAGTAASDYSYAITSSHANPNLSDAVTEGQDASFTITRTLASGKTASAATVYVSTRDGTATVETADYEFNFNLAVDFKKDELSKEVTIPTFSDSASDDGEYFFLELYKNEVLDVSTFQNQEQEPDGWGKAYIKNDATEVSNASTYNYAVSSSHGNNSGAAKEGETITFTITRTREDGSSIGSSDKPTTVFVSTSEASAYNNDYQSLNLAPVDFKKDETVKTVTVDTIVDTDNDEGTEYFWFDLYKTKSDADNFDYHSWAQGHIKNDTSLANSLGNYTYSVASSTSDGNGVKEGGDITFTITRTKVDNGQADVKSTVYVSTSEGSAYEDDYVPLDLKKVKFKKTETKKTVTVKTKKDSVTDDNESFWFDVFKTTAAADNYDYAAWAEGHIADDAGAVTAAATYEYAVTSSHNAANNKATEGSDITFTIVRTNSGGGANSASTVYISTTPGSASKDDFEVITNKAIEFKADESSKQITVGTKKDADADDGEYFWFDVYKSLSAAENFEYYKWDQGFIADDTSAADALNNYTYTVTSANNSGNKVTEGGLATFTISRSEIDASKANVAATVYVATAVGTAGEDDFEMVTKKAIDFKKDETSKTFTVQTKEDGATESGGEYFALELYKTEGDLEDGEYTAYGKAFIADNASAALAVSNYNYTVTGSNNTEGKAASEGSDMTFTITRAEIDASQTDVASTVYVSSTHSTTDAEDVESWDKKKVEFLKDELTKTITIKTNTDTETEGYESFWLDLFKTEADADDGNYAAWDVGYLKDNTTAANATNNYNYTITTTAGKLDPVTEGTDITFTITRARVDGKEIKYYTNSSDQAGNIASTVYVGTQDSSATSSDYEAMVVPTELKFLPLDKTKTITVKTYSDEETEQNESFYLGLFKTKGAINSYAETGDESLVDAYTAGYMKDPAAVSGVGTFSYTVTTNSPSNSAKTEGSDITVTITRNISGGNPGDSTIYMNTTPGSAGDDDYTAHKATPVVFASSDANGATKTITIKTSTDALSESKENFYVDLFKTIADANEGWPYFTFDTAYIANGAADASASRTYTIDNNSKTQGAARDEGTTVTFTITVDDTDAASKVWVSTKDGTAKAGEDYTAITKKEISFAQGDSSETVTVTLLNDTDTTDDNEAFYLELYKSKKDAEEGDEHSYSKALINNTSVTDNYYYKVVSSHGSSSPVTEGSDITFTITRWSNSQKTTQGTTGDTTLYVSTSASYNSTDDDFQKITADPLTFKNGEHSKTYTVSTTADSASEGKELFWFDVYKEKKDAEDDNWGGTNGYTSGYITDGSGSFIPTDASSNSPSYTYTITNQNSVLGNSGTVIEGDDAIFTITRSGTGSESTVYVSTYITDEAGYAGEEDFAALDHVVVIFGKDETVKEIRTATVLDDNKSEANEFFYLRMNKGATGETYEPGVYDDVTITQPSGMLGTIALGGNSGSISGTDTVTVTAASKTSFPGHKAGQFFNDFAFSAKTTNGKVVSWGNADKGGDNSGVSSHLTSVSQIYSNASAFAAVKTDGSVVTWGNANAGGTSWDADGLSVSASLSGSGNLTLGGAATSSGSATFSKGNKITITSAGDDSGRKFTVTGTDAGGSSQTEEITGANAGTAEGTKLFKTVTQIAVDGATAGKVTAGNLFSLTYDMASDLNGGTDVTKIASTADAFAAIRADGSVKTWGNKGTGGDSSSVSSSLNGTVNVRDIYSNMSAFAAIRDDGSVITWGYGLYGGDSSSVVNKITTTGHSDFKTVTDISATGSAFAAIRSDGSVVTWGNSQDGGDSSGVASAIDGDTDPTDVVQVYATTSAFAALQKNGAVITWGDVNNGGSISAVSASLNGATDVTQIFSTNTAFAALRSDGSVITWGKAADGGNSSSVTADIDGDSNGDGNTSDTTQDITKIVSTTGAFAAIRADNKVVTWGYGAYGGDSSSVTSIINGTLDADSVSVSASVSAGGNFVLGGDQTSGGAASFANAEKITFTSAGDDSARTFKITGTDATGNAQTEDVTGGNAKAVTSTKYFKTVTQISVDSGGNTAGAVTAGVVNKEVKTIVSTDKAFAALLKDGSVITWGDSSAGGDSSSVSGKLIMGTTNSSVVESLSASSGAFSAIKADGSVVTWGNSDLGGDSSGIDFSANKVQGMSGAS